MIVRDMGCASFETILRSSASRDRCWRNGRTRTKLRLRNELAKVETTGRKVQRKEIRLSPSFLVQRQFDNVASCKVNVTCCTQMRAGPNTGLNLAHLSCGCSLLNYSAISTFHLHNCEREISASGF